MGQLKVGSIEIGEERFCIQMVGPITLNGPAILQQRKPGEVYVLSGQANDSSQAVIMLPFDVPTHHVKICPPVQVTQHSPSMSLQVECAGDWNILPEECPHVGERSILHLSHGVDRRLIVEGDPPPADVVSLQLTRGVQ